jgi:hypothetical protein
MQVRVWWPPTRDKNRTGFSGAFWPAAVVARGKSHFTVRYDNEDEERVNCENIFPYEVPVDFGHEVEDLQVRRTAAHGRPYAWSTSSVRVRRAGRPACGGSQQCAACMRAGPRPHSAQGEGAGVLLG